MSKNFCKFKQNNRIKILSNILIANSILEFHSKVVYLHENYGKNEKAFARKPFFVALFELEYMEFRNRIEDLLNGFLAEREDLFLIDLKISAGDDVVVILDGDNGVTLQDCLDASRAIEFNMDREEHDFSLQVMSAGLSEPLESPRQYLKNLGRDIEVQLSDSEKIEGELSKVSDDGITLVLRYRKPKEIGKGKVDVVEEKEIPFTEIKKALVTIKF